MRCDATRRVSLEVSRILIEMTMMMMMEMEEEEEEDEKRLAIMAMETIDGSSAAFRQVGSDATLVDEMVGDFLPTRRCDLDKPAAGVGLIKVQNVQTGSAPQNNCNGRLPPACENAVHHPRNGPGSAPDIILRQSKERRLTMVKDPLQSFRGGLPKCPLTTRRCDRKLASPEM